MHQYFQAVLYYGVKPFLSKNACFSPFLMIKAQSADKKKQSA